MKRIIEDNNYLIEKDDIVRNFDCYVLSIDTKGGGGYFTSFPISPKVYREALKSKGRILPDKVEINYDGEFTIFLITDDWGNKYEVSIENCHYSAIQYGIEKAKEYGLLSP